MRSPADMDILVVDITNRCFLACSNCTRDVSHQSRTREMDPDTFRAALDSIRAWWKPGRVIGLIGGEPTLNKHFDEICRIFRAEFNPDITLPIGRAPISDMNAFAQKRLFDRRSGRGLWTSFGPHFMRHYEAIMDTFPHWNSNDHSQGGKHQASLIDAREMCAALGIPWEEWPKYRDACWLQNKWSASITPDGKAYFCERAAQLDALYNEGKLGWDVRAEPDWWKRTPDQFGDQLSICEMCSMALPGPGQVDSLDRDIISENHRIRLEMVGSPAVKGGRYQQWDPGKQSERRHITTKDNYVADTGIRCAADNPYVHAPKRLSLVITCVGRAEHLKQTLAHNARLADEVIVVTHPSDTETLSLIEPPVRIVLSTRCFEDGHAFNKGKMLNSGLAAIHKPDWILFTDADVFLPETLPEYLKTHVLNPGVLYGAARLDVGSTAAPTGINAECNGFFQLWSPRAQSLQNLPKHPNGTPVLCEEFCSAGGIDSWFMTQFTKQP